jgi:inner membrane transporter RhtA
MTLLRLALGGLLLVAVTRPAVHRWSRAQWTAAVALGVCMGAMNLSFYLAIREVPLGVAVTVEFLGPLLVALVQTRRATDLLWVVLAGAGVALLGLGDGGDVPLTGLALALLAGLFWAGYILASARVGRVLEGLDGLAVALLVGALLVLPFGLGGAADAVADGWALLAGVAVALLSSVIPYALELTALRTIPTRVFGVLMSLEPAAAAVAGLLVLGQTLGPRELAALLLVSVASAGVTLGARRGREVTQPLE